jgi:hypothetical protein
MVTSRSWALVVTGYSVLALAMLAFLTVNGVSGAAAGTIATASLIVLGFLLTAVGLLEMARHLDPRQGTVRKGLVLQGLGLIGLLIGLVVSFVASSLAGHLVSAVFIVPSGAAALAGAILISRELRARQLVAGAVLIAIGATLIPVANLAQFAYLVLDTDKNLYQDIGAALAGCGCVLAAYSFFVLRGRREAPVFSRP